MNKIIMVLRALTGLIVDDGWFALAILAVIVLAGMSAKLTPANSLVTGAILLFGCLAVLVVNVTRVARR